jgi:hypothetical protein
LLRNGVLRSGWSFISDGANSPGGNYRQRQLGGWRPQQWRGPAGHQLVVVGFIDGNRH